MRDNNITQFMKKEFTSSQNNHQTPPLYEAMCYMLFVCYCVKQAIYHKLTKKILYIKAQK